MPQGIDSYTVSLVALRLNGCYWPGAAMPPTEGACLGAVALARSGSEGTPSTDGVYPRGGVSLPRGGQISLFWNVKPPDLN